jgi:hypothetical protein
MGSDGENRLLGTTAGADAGGTHSTPSYLYPSSSSFRTVETRCLPILLTLPAPRYSTEVRSLRRQVHGRSDAAEYPQSNKKSRAQDGLNGETKDLKTTVNTPPG